MGIGGGIFLIAFGAILAFAVHAKISWLDLGVVGWVLMLAGAAVMLLTIYFWNERRRRDRLTLVEQSRYVHDRTSPINPEPPDSGTSPPPLG